MTVDSWNEYRCRHCATLGIYNNGDVNDFTMPDVDTVKCWQCGKVTSVHPEDCDCMECDSADEKAAESYFDTEGMPLPKRA